MQVGSVALDGPLSGGIHCRIASVCEVKPRPGLILDRDGVIVAEVNYLASAENVCLVPGATAFLRRSRIYGIPVGVATNQAGIARGYYGWPDYELVLRRMEELLAFDGVGIDGSAACSFHPDFTPDYGAAHAYWRKPGPGLVCLLADQLAIDLSNSWIAGDTASDLVAGKAAGMAGGIHVLTGHGRKYRAEALALADETFEVVGCRDLSEAGHIFDRLRGVSTKQAHFGSTYL